MADKYIYNTGYAYCDGNPLKYIDPDGNVIESIWDALWVTIDIASIAYDLVVGDTQQAQLDAASLATDAIALVIPGVPAVGGVARAATRLATKTDDAAKAINRSQSVSKTHRSSNSIPGPTANKGNAKPHGGTKHNKIIDSKIEMLRQLGAKNIRKNQIQVDVNGNRVGNNRPDIQYDLNGEHHIIEIDTKQVNSQKHFEIIKENDPNSKIHLIIIES